FRDPRRDKVHGRIWRITATGRLPVPRPALATASVPVLLGHLQSPERWTRHQARRRLAAEPADRVLPELRSWVDTLDAADPRHERHLIEALAVCESLDAPEPALLTRLLRANDPRARAYAVEVAGRWQQRLPEATTWLARAAADEHPRVRLQAVVAASRGQRERNVEIALTVTDQPVDRFINDALIQAVHALKPVWLPAFTAGRLDFTGRAHRLEHLLRIDASADTLRATVRLVRRGDLAPDTRAALLTVLAGVGDPQELALLLDAATYRVAGRYDPELHARLLPELIRAERVRRLRPPGDLAASLAPLLRADAVALRASALRLAGAWRLEALRPAIESVAATSTEPESIRRASLEALAGYADPAARAFLQKLAAESEPAPVRAAAVAALAGLDVTLAAQPAAQMLQQEAPDAVRAEIWNAFLTRQDGAAALVAALRQRPPTPDAARVGLRQMSASGQRDEALATLLSDAAGLAREPRSWSPEEMAAFAAEALRQGDAARGAEVYLRPELNCVACHAINGRGGAIGPDLSSLGTAQPAEFIMGALLDPNREVKEGYTAVEIVTRTGDLHQGYVVRETPAELVVRDIALNAEITLRKDAIASRVPRGSVMPAGLTDLLTRTELRDLLRYLAGLGRDAK
ncbi:MAG TPA: HEAT repeat domain-containing protein, partial [Methylomirabilota bacterium]|nr:HEAT repeat domain-containing protein [Methylomirabilota bacterium]